jgi:hypothetical protein
MRIADLQPGDIVSIPNLPDQQCTWVFVGMITPHPMFPGLTLVIWARCVPGKDTEWSMDALNPHANLTTMARLDSRNRMANLRKVFTPGALR